MVDDEPDIRGLVKEILEDEDFEVDTAEDGVSARRHINGALLEERHPSLDVASVVRVLCPVDEGADGSHVTQGSIGRILPAATTAECERAEEDGVGESHSSIPRSRDLSILPSTDWYGPGRPQSTS